MRERGAILIAQKKLKAILFDMDGVIILSLKAQYRAWTWWCDIHGLRPEPYLEAHGLTGAEKIRRFAPPYLDPAAEAERVTDYEVADTAGVTAATGAERLPSLRLPFCVVTSAAASLARARLTAAGLPVPRHLITAESVARGKPDPEPYLLGATCLGVAPSECVVVEDAAAGVQSGQAAGMKVVALTTTVGEEELDEADLILPSLTAFFAWLGDAYMRENRPQQGSSRYGGQR